MTTKAAVTKVTPKKERRDWRTAFLARLSKSPDVSAAAKAARISRKHAYETRKTDEGFAAAWDDAIGQSVEAAEGEAYRRAVSGTKKPVYQGGKHVGDIQEYSDTLLIFLLKAHKPAVYRETVKQTIEHTGAPLGVTFIDYRAGITAPESGSVRDPDAPGADEGHSGGQAVG